MNYFEHQKAICIHGEGREVSKVLNILFHTQQKRVPLHLDMQTKIKPGARTPDSVTTKYDSLSETILLPRTDLVQNHYWTGKFIFFISVSIV